MGKVWLIMSFTACLHIKDKGANDWKVSFRAKNQTIIQFM